MHKLYNIWAFQVVLMVKKLPANTGDARDVGSVPGLDYPLEEGMATHSSILAWRIPMDRGAWQAIVHGVSTSWIWLKQLIKHTYQAYISPILWTHDAKSQLPRKDPDAG